mmetsp:Transcript_30768/g.46460  ORF Transcript_30768/g.46460 Transcript_30768/m.46460 type:complete len:107 (-) Transcript_30768:352-672(-)
MENDACTLALRLAEFGPAGSSLGFLAKSSQCHFGVDLSHRCTLITPQLCFILLHSCPFLACHSLAPLQHSASLAAVGKVRAREDAFRVQACRGGDCRRAAVAAAPA